MMMLQNSLTAPSPDLFLKTLNPFTQGAHVRQAHPSVLPLKYPPFTYAHTHIWPGGKLSPNIPTEANLHPFRGL